MKLIIDKRSALIIVDLQRDFCPGGALPVPDGDRVVPILNKYVKKVERTGAPIYATQDWHPPNHISFKARGGPWPPHCVQGTKGAEFHPDLRIPKEVKIIRKASNPDREAYSGFDGTDLGDELKKLGIERAFVGGLATDYCVKNTVLDALRLGFKVTLLEDAIRGVNIKPSDSNRAILEMIEKGAEKTVYSQVR